MFQKISIATLAMATAGTEYSTSIAESTRKLVFRSRGNGNVKVGTSAGAIAGGTYFTIPAGGSYAIDMVYLKATTLYFVSDVSSDVLEILTVTD